jgi:UDP-glucose 4-epimerase
MSAVLLTGATTPFGRALAQALLADPSFGDVLAVGAERGAPGLPSDPRLHYHRIDLTRPRDLATLMGGPARELGVTAVVHGAWHRRAADVGPRIQKLNVASTRELLRLSEEHPTVRHFLLRSYADVYRMVPDEAVLITEDHPLRLSMRMPQIERDRLEADVLVAMRMGMSRMSITVLRMAEIVAPDSGSQLYDYLSSKVCFRPIGFDPMLSLLSIDDAVRATIAALRTRAQGIFNIPGKDILPLSRAVELARRTSIPVPGPLLAPLYGLRARTMHTDFRYGLNYFRFHLSGVLDGTRAREVLMFEPQIGLDWEEIARVARV